MAATKTRLTCPHCGRSTAVRHNTGGLCHHGRRGRKCPASGLTPVNGDLTAKQVEFFRHCWLHGDALPIARILHTTYPQPDIPPLCADHAVEFMVNSARDWIKRAYMELGNGVPA